MARGIVGVRSHEEGGSYEGDSTGVMSGAAAGWLAVA
jgi:hypothetical protein